MNRWEKFEQQAEEASRGQKAISPTEKNCTSMNFDLADNRQGDNGAVHSVDDQQDIKRPSWLKLLWNRLTGRSMPTSTAENDVPKRHLPYNDFAGDDVRFGAIKDMKDIQMTLDQYVHQIEINKNIVFNVREKYKENAEYIKQVGNITEPADFQNLLRLNTFAERSLQEIIKNLCKLPLLQRHIEDLVKEKELSAPDNTPEGAKIKGAEDAIKYIEQQADKHLSRLTARMQWFPVVYHVVDKVGLFVLPVLGYYIGKYGLDDKSLFMWGVACMPLIFVEGIFILNWIFSRMERSSKAK